MPPPSGSDATAQLCPACGLCCNGVLFGDVELGPQDDPESLNALGLSLKRKGRKLAFAQPCSCFDGRLCQIYKARPERCRTFECGLLKRVNSGELTAGAALKTIAGTRHAAQQIRELMDRLGGPAEKSALSRRYARIMAEPINLAGDQESVELRAELMLAVDGLMRALHKDFLT